MDVDAWVDAGRGGGMRERILRSVAWWRRGVNAGEGRGLGSGVGGAGELGEACEDGGGGVGE